PGGREVQGDPGILSKPGPDPGVVVGGVVVADHVQLLAGPGGGHLLQEAQRTPDGGAGGSRRPPPGRAGSLSGQAVETPASTLEPDRPWAGRPEAHPGVPDGRVSEER